MSAVVVANVVVVAAVKGCMSGQVAGPPYHCRHGCWKVNLKEAGLQMVWWL